jgi:hypothetical protein
MFLLSEVSACNISPSFPRFFFFRGVHSPTTNTNCSLLKASSPRTVPLLRFQLVQVITIIQRLSSFFSLFFSPNSGEKLSRVAGGPTFPALLLQRGPAPPYSPVPDLLQPAGHPGRSLHELQSESLPVELL